MAAAGFGYVTATENAVFKSAAGRVVSSAITSTRTLLLPFFTSTSAGMLNENTIID